MRTDRRRTGPERDMAEQRAITNLGNQREELFLRSVAQGIERLVANIDRLDSSAHRLSGAGDEASATLLGSFADEEAAKVLMLIDAVRCPAEEGRARVRTLKRWSDHLWKGVYVRACDWRPADFRELTTYIDDELQPFYLDGPIGIDWIFRNEILAQRERQIYVDLVEDITETGPNRQEPYWVAPGAFSSYRFNYQTSTCVEIALSLHACGISTERGLNHVARIWQPLDIVSMGYPELLARIRETLLAVQPEEDESTASDRVVPSRNKLIHWPHPLWPYDRLERPATVDSLREERGVALEHIRHIRGLKDPPPAISRQKVEELHDAYVLAEEERKRVLDDHRTVACGRGVILSRTVLDDLDTPAWLKLRELWRELSDDEKVSLVALSWFTRDSIGDWPASFKWAQEWGGYIGDLKSADAENYCLGLASKWLQGYQRWEAPPDVGHMLIGSE